MASGGSQVEIHILINPQTTAYLILMQESKHGDHLTNLEQQHTDKGHNYY